MPGPIDWDDLVLAPCMAVFGEDNDPLNDQRPIFTPAAGGGSFPVDGIFDDGYVSKVLLDDGAPGFTSTNPVLGVRASEFLALSQALPLQGDQVAIPRNGKTYLVSEVQSDNKGLIVLQLNEAT